MCPVKTEKPDWKKIARRAVQERDPDKLLAIIEELNAVLEAGANERRARLTLHPGTELGSASCSWTTSPTSVLPCHRFSSNTGFKCRSRLPCPKRLPPSAATPSMLCSLI